MLERIMTVLRLSVRRAAFTVFLTMVLGFLIAGHSYAERVYTLWFVGFSPATPPADSLELRQAIAYSLDREVVAKAVAAHAVQPPHPAVGIQHPGLPGYNPGVRGYSYDPVKAKELYGSSGWTAPITIFVGPATSKFLEALHETVLGSIRKTLGAPVLVGRVANFGALVEMTKTGLAAVYIFGWRSDPKDFGYPSFALGLANDRPFDPNVKALLEKRDVNALEQLMLDKALIIPVIYY